MPAVIKSSEGTETNFRGLESVSQGNRRRVIFGDPSNILSEALVELDASKHVIIMGAPGSGKASLMAAMVAEAVESTTAVENQTDIGVTPKWSAQIFRSPVFDDSAPVFRSRTVMKFIEFAGSSHPVIVHQWELIPRQLLTQISPSKDHWELLYEEENTSAGLTPAEGTLTYRVDDEPNIGATPVSEPEILFEADVRFPPKRTRTMVGKVGKRGRAQFKTGFVDELVDHGGAV